MAIELETKTCRLCGEDLHPARSIDEQESLVNAARIKAIDLKRKLDQLRKKVRGLDRQINAAELKKQEYSQEFLDISRQERAGLSSELRSTEQRLGYLRGQLDQLREQSKEGQKDKLQEMKVHRDVLKVASQELQQMVSQLGANLIANLERETTRLAIKFGVSHLSNISINDSANLMVRQSSNWRFYGKLEAGERLRLKLAFHLAMILLRVREGIGRHPGLLFVDAPGGSELDKMNFGAILQIFREIQNEYSDKVQILIASTKEELVDICGRSNVDIRQAGETLF